jgi:hypothetical protein
LRHGLLIRQCIEDDTGGALQGGGELVFLARQQQVRFLAGVCRCARGGERRTSRAGRTHAGRQRPNEPGGLQRRVLRQRLSRQVGNQLQLVAERSGRQSGHRRDATDRRVDAVEERSLAIAGGRLVLAHAAGTRGQHEPQIGPHIAARLDGPHFLRFVLAAAFRRNLRVGAAEDRIERTGDDLEQAGL